MDSPSLRGAYARTSRAKHHITFLDSEWPKISAWRKAYPNSAISVPAHTTGLFEDATNGVLQPEADQLISASIVVGEAIHNLRAALDYLVYELAFLDSGRPQKKTQFPIADTQENWTKAEDRRLKGVSPPHRDAIRQWQPFTGCEWPRTLRELSDQDKHRRLTYTKQPQSLTFRVDTNSTGLNLITPLTEDLPVGLSGEIILLVFEDGRQVLKELRMLHNEVCAVLDAFTLEFDAATESA